MALSALDERVSHLTAHAIEQSTKKGYSTSIKSYIRFCLIHDLPLDPTPQNLARYIAYVSQYINSAPQYLSGIRHFLREFFPNFDDNRSSTLVQAAIRGSRKVRANPIRRKLPLRTSHLQTFLDLATSSGTFDDLLFITIISCAFYGCHRIGELVQRNDQSLFDWRKIIKRASLSFPDNYYAQYHLPYHKSDPFYHGTDVRFVPQAIANPITLLQQYCFRRDSHHGLRAPLFLRENGSHPTRSWFNHRLHNLLPYSYGGHSMRAGGATFYASLGLDESIIQSLGRWSSSAWKIYLRDHPAVRAAQQLALLSSHRLLATSLSPPPPPHTSLAANQ
ncbi:hypothetical protein M378DRAFT_188756 [Amanita muscaria Koide BX008]|uniref:Tyr recombinase domain-containing protein n=1 Tax=Amanita muscaria (strain Koide BX008) TaxID=946122 RepID=A0A0C2WCI1_AMAMK|nr:hypothetical protein M378DRAFT_188756 [Amanita muscaria Koide BX008]